MENSINFSSYTPRFEFPLIFSTQSQKEILVNESLAAIDALLHCAVEGEASSPPASPSEGTNWLVGTSASGGWSGQDSKIACFQEGNWIFVTPRDGMRLLDRSTGQTITFLGQWQRPVTPELPTGGSVVDDIARTAIGNLVAALKTAGILASS